jgi:lysophospholipase L1-like esterase
MCRILPTSAHWPCHGVILGGLAAVIFWLPAGRAEDRHAEKWAKTIADFEEQDRRAPPQPGGVVFVGSSSIRLWNLAESFPDHHCLNRGFGGSRLTDVVKFMDRIVIPYKPRVVVLYAGDNDLAAQRTPTQIRDDYRSFVNHLHAALPETLVVWISIKPSPKRWALRELAEQANVLVRAEIERGRNQVEVDIWSAMLDASGQPRPELYADDQLHLSRAGYALWTARVRPHLLPQDP